MTVLTTESPAIHQNQLAPLMTSGVAWATTARLMVVVWVNGFSAMDVWWSGGGAPSVCGVFARLASRGCVTRSQLRQNPAGGIHTPAPRMTLACQPRIF